VRRLLPLILVALAFAAFGILWIVTDRRASARVYDAYSSANTSNSGLSLASGYLGKQRKVAMLTRSLARAPIESSAVVFRVTDELPTFFDPEDLDEKQVGPPKPKQRPLLSDADDAFLRNGGRMIITAENGLLETAETDAKVVSKVFPIWPAVGDLKPECDCKKLRGFTQLRPRMHALFIAGPRVILARERIGKGELFVLSTPELLANYQLSKAGHLALLSGLAGDKRPVYFDETLHGIVSDDGSLALMKDWNLGPFLLLLGILTILVFWREGTRVGTPDDEFRDTRSDAIDLVRSLAALYRGVTGDGEAIALYYDALTRTVAHQTGLRGEALRKRVDELTGGMIPPAGRGKMPAAIFKRQLGILNDAFLRVSQSHSLTVSQGAGNKSL
jgi:hypothetical protein